MNRLVRTRTDPDDMRARILEVAEQYCRRIGYHKTSVTDIASELGMSRANVYRFFPSKDAIHEAILQRAVGEVADIAIAIARTGAPASEKLEQVLTTVHRHNKTKLVKERCMHDMIVAAMQENWRSMNAHRARMVTILETILREGSEAGDLLVEDPGVAARAVTTAFAPILNPILLEHRVRCGEDTEAGLRAQIRFVLKALGKSH